MAIYLPLMHAFNGLSFLLLVGLGYVWGRNFLQFRSKHTLGLFVFVLLLLGENALSLYLFVLDPTLSAWIENPSNVPVIAQQAMVTLRILEFAGIAFLSWVTEE